MASILALLSLVLASWLGSLVTPQEPVAAAPVVEARVIGIAPNIRVYTLRSTRLLVPVRDQAAFDAAAGAFAELRYSVRTHVEVELTNTSDEPLFLSYDVVVGLEGTSELTDPAAKQDRSAWRIWPIILGEPADPEPAIFLAPGQPLRHTFALASRLEPFMFEMPSGVFPEQLSLSFKRSTRGFAANASPDAAADTRVEIQWSGSPEVRLSDVSF